ncbi:MAG: hypothetical protein ACREBS_01740 [Nitrososphaerales archaeon]
MGIVLLLPRLGRPILIGIIIAVLILAGSIAVIVYETSPHSTSGSSCSVLLDSHTSAPGVANDTSSNSIAYFTIIEASPFPLGNPYVGFNGSYYHYSDPPWPLMVVNQGQSVEIHIMNCSSVEPHGFAVIHYFGSGVSLQPRQNYTLTFVANQAGNFTVFCNIYCSIHPNMQYGELMVV